MIPPFVEHGYLPMGVHPSTLDEIEARFGRHTALRRDQMESLRWLVEVAQRVGVTRLVVNGSFTTATPEPNDVDCVLLMGSHFPQDVAAEQELLAGLPFIEIQLVRQARFDMLVENFFATDRQSIPKGMVEVLL